MADLRSIVSTFVLVVQRTHLRYFQRYYLVPKRRFGVKGRAENWKHWIERRGEGGERFRLAVSNPAVSPKPRYGKVEVNRTCESGKKKGNPNLNCQFIEVVQCRKGERKRI